MAGRTAQLQQIQRELRALQPTSASQAYAIAANLELLEGLRTTNSFLAWVGQQMPLLDPERILEINELLPSWDETVHGELLDVEQRRFPGFITPLVQELTARILSTPGPAKVLDVGSGAMEVERQVAIKLIARRHSPRVTFIGLDASIQARACAEVNLGSLPECQVRSVEAEELFPALAEPQVEPIRFLLCRGSSDLVSRFEPKSLTVLFDSFLAHHLSAAALRTLQLDARRVAGAYLEYDGYRQWAQFALLNLANWTRPAFHAAGIFSYVRYRYKRELRGQWGQQIRFFPNGCYLAMSD